MTHTSTDGSYVAVSLSGGGGGGGGDGEAARCCCCCCCWRRRRGRGRRRGRLVVHHRPRRRARVRIVPLWHLRAQRRLPIRRRRGGRLRRGVGVGGGVLALRDDRAEVPRLLDDRRIVEPRAFALDHVQKLPDAVLQVRVRLGEVLQRADDGVRPRRVRPRRRRRAARGLGLVGRRRRRDALLLLLLLALRLRRDVQRRGPAVDDLRLSRRRKRPRRRRVVHDGTTRAGARSGPGAAAVLHVARVHLAVPREGVFVPLAAPGQGRPGAMIRLRGGFFQDGLVVAPRRRGGSSAAAAASRRRPPLLPVDSFTGTR